MRKLRFFKASSFYSTYIDYFIKRNQNIEGYRELYNTISGDFYDWADSWKFYLEESEKYEVFESVVNFEMLQKQWAREKNIRYRSENWKFDILEEQIKAFMPDILFAHDNAIVNANFIKKIRANVKSIKLVIGYDGTGLLDPEKFSEHDLIFSCLPETAAFYNLEKIGFYLPFGFDERILKSIKTRNKRHYFTFSGSVFYEKNYHMQRFLFVLKLLKKTKLQIFADNHKNIWGKISKRQIKRLLKFRFNEFLNSYIFEAKRQPPLFGMEMYQMLSDSFLTFNIHGDKVGPHAANRRLFEATGVGTALLTDWKDNITDFFVNGQEILTYNSIEEAINLVRYYENKKDILLKIGEKAQERTLKDHTMRDRILSFSHFILSILR